MTIIVFRDPTNTPILRIMVEGTIKPGLVQTIALMTRDTLPAGTTFQVSNT